MAPGSGPTARAPSSPSPITQPIGSIGLLKADHFQHRIEAGYWTAPWARSHGHTRRALRLATRWALTQGGLDTVALEVEQDNPASTAVATAVGYLPSDLPIQHIELKGSLRAFVSYQITLTELRER